MMNSVLKTFVVSVGVLSIATAMSGCIVQNLGQTVEQTVKGDYFLQSDQPKRGRESFRVEVEENPDSHLAHYYYGRFLLQGEEPELALNHLSRAQALSPEKAEYQFWLGVAYGATGNIDKEEACYRAALDLDKNHLQTLIYLGHNQFAQKQYIDALHYYYQALDIWPSSPSALYNRALILHILGRTPEERVAWLDYLERYPSGAKARQAADYVNMTGDFNFRNHIVGATVVTLEKIRFEPFTAELSSASYDSLHVIGEVFQDMQRGTLQVVVFQKNNKALAKDRALAVRRFLLAEFPQIKTGQIGVSWFAEPQRLSINKKKLSIDESVNFFVTE